MPLNFSTGTNMSFLKEVRKEEKKLQEEGIGFHFPILKDAKLNSVWNLRKAGLGIIDNLSFIFAAGMALGMAKRERAVTALSSVIAFFVMYALINVLLVINGQILADNSIVIMF